ncbi:hypothetical protein PULV_a2044 [Pseudoalteromonas ulvae UL12]|uniref:Oxidoreductase n=1 Tax=Pseudoalteromonas ulvae TaxID=107327 RepID=A0A244CQB7_PSEDV|nr:FAD-dependent oxidoreductase [Pseudoalteromonas ulvae]MBE0365277.1 hypothetical protein [Pseudoalteromonas ulvae UL12]OUL57811.1 oxidoreductase [Pseudoalteromonas ulvae]
MYTSSAIENTHLQPLKVGIIGGGVAGSTIALRLGEIGVDVTVLEQGPSLVNGPPFCHLHAGGNLYREISEQQCLTLLQQSIDTLKVYPLSANIRPTVIAVPKHDSGDPLDYLPRLSKLQAFYQQLVKQDPSNQVLGKPSDYYRLFTREEAQTLAKKHTPISINSLDDWLIPVAKHINFEQLKWPIILVQEYGLSAFRLAAIASLSFEKMPHCNIQTHCQVQHVQFQDQQWQVKTNQGHHQFDYLINAAGFQTGEIDDMAALTRERMVEFKAAYVAHWPEAVGHWPEVIFLGQRGTPNGMAQLTPYPGGYFQLHGMTKDITLFEHGLVKNTRHSAQPKLPEHLLNQARHKWHDFEVTQRSKKSISHLAQFLPQFASALPAGKPLYGAQQIPGDDPTLRAANVSFEKHNYVRAEIVKASSALRASDEIVKDLVAKGFVDKQALQLGHLFTHTKAVNNQAVCELAQRLAQERNYPIELALTN